MGTMCDNFIIYEDNKNEFQIWQGLIGAHYTPHVDSLGNLSWTNNGGLPNPETVNIAGRGLNIVGIVDEDTDLPETANNFDTYLVGTEDPYSAYIYDDGTWYNLGIVGQGEKGDKGDPGVGVPTGGTTGQVLKKKSNTNYDTEWGSVEALPTGGTTGQALVKHSNSNYDVEWANQSGGADPATATPLMDGTAAVGTATKYAREDHVHPTDTSRQATLVSGTNIKTINNESILGSGNISITSGVSSVNGATGTVVLDADDVGAMAEWVLLWENASPTSAFAAQTVQLNLSSYDAVFIYYQNSTPKSYGSPIILVGTPEYVFRFSSNNGNNQRYFTRSATVTTSGVEFSACQYFQQGSSNGTAQNTDLVPVKIYGIKGFKNS